MNFICDDKEIFKKYKEIWEKIRSKIDKEFAKEPTYEYNKYAYINTKIREFEGVIRTNFYKNKVLKAPNKIFLYKCLSLIKLESVIRSEEFLHYPQTTLKECKYDVKNIKKNRHITDELERSASDESDNEPETECDSGSSDDDDEEFFRKSENNESKNPSKKACKESN